MLHRQNKYLCTEGRRKYIVRPNPQGSSQRFAQRVSTSRDVRRGILRDPYSFPSRADFVFLTSRLGFPSMYFPPGSVPLFLSLSSHVTKDKIAEIACPFSRCFLALQIEIARTTSANGGGFQDGRGYAKIENVLQTCL